MARSCMRVFLLVLLPLTFIGCAQGFEGNSDDDVQTRVDARPNVQIDAPTSFIDAPTTPIDAPVIVIDAPIGSVDSGTTTGACTTHAECGAGNCCNGLLMVCQVGDPLPLPPPLDCILPPP